MIISVKEGEIIINMVIVKVKGLLLFYYLIILDHRNVSASKHFNLLKKGNRPAHKVRMKMAGYTKYVLKSFVLKKCLVVGIVIAYAYD